MSNSAITETPPLILNSDLDFVRAQDRAGGTYRRMLDAMAEDVRSFAASFSDDPKRLSDWGHKYFCPEDGGRLLWDPKDRGAHRCIVCGKIYSGEPYDSVWTTFYRNEAFQTARKAAVLSAVRGGDEWIAAMEKILGFYADRYEQFELHSKDRRVSASVVDGLGAGKIMPQGLNEAILVVRCIQAMTIARTRLSASFIDRMREGFLLPAKELLLPQSNRIHNIPCWIDSALGAVGVFEEDEQLVRFALSVRDFGLGAQLSRGVTKDGFWYEGSLHYHFFTLEGVLSFMLLAARAGIRRPKIEESLERMLVQPFRLAFDSGRLPNPNDGWPDIGLKTYSYVYDLGAAFFGSDSQVAALQRALEKDAAPRSEIPLSRPYYFDDRISLERLMFNPRAEDSEARSWAGSLPDVSRASAVYRASCFAMLRDRGLNVLLKYGHNGPSHAHPDKMTLEVVANGAYLSRDLSNAGYGARLCDEWHRTTPAHNTVVVDGADHLSMERGRLLWFDDHVAATRAANVYRGVDFERTISLIPDGFRDVFDVVSEGAHIYDWFFHIDGTLLSAPEGVPGSLDYCEGGYKHVKSVRDLGSAASLSLSWRFGGGVAHCLVECPGARALLAITPDNPVDRSRSTLVLRAAGSVFSFKTTWTIEEKSE
jgi:hypothetical protein